MKNLKIINVGDVFLDTFGIHQKCKKVMFYSSLYNENLYEFHTGKMEYHSDIILNWTKTDLEHIPGEQLNLF